VLDGCLGTQDGTTRTTRLAVRGLGNTNAWWLREKMPAGFR
jgi:hypothetical protein